MLHPVHHRLPWSLDALSRADFMALLELAGDLERAGGAGVTQRPLSGKNVAVVGASGSDGKSSAFERAVTGLGAQVSHLHPTPFVDGCRPESARFLGRLYDAVDCEGLDSATVQAIDKASGVPVFSGLADEDHPLHVIATLLHIQSRTGRPPNAARVAYLGDIRTPRGDALLQAAALAGMELRILGEPGVGPDSQRLARAMQHAQRSGARLVQLDSPADAIRGADIVLDERNGAASASQSHLHYALQAILVRSMCH